MIFCSETLSRAVVTESNERNLSRNKWSQVVRLIIGSRGPFQPDPKKNFLDETIELTFLKCKCRLGKIYTCDQF